MAHGFDGYVEDLCERFYELGERPSIPLGVYFRCLPLGLFEGIDSERGIAWRVADSMSLRSFLGLPLDKTPRPLHAVATRRPSHAAAANLCPPHWCVVGSARAVSRNNRRIVGVGGSFWPERSAGALESSAGIRMAPTGAPGGNPMSPGESGPLAPSNSPVSRSRSCSGGAGLGERG